MSITMIGESSWVVTDKLATADETQFNMIKAHIPNTTETMKYDGHVYYAPRKSKSFGFEYGSSNEPIPTDLIPDDLLPYLEIANEYAEAMNHPLFNQCNNDRFSTKDSYIHLHIEDITFTYTWGEVSILMYQIFFARGEGVNIFVTFKDAKTLATIELENGMIMIMNGETQR